jgi:hypothetical protein
MTQGPQGEVIRIDPLTGSVLNTFISPSGQFQGLDSSKGRRPRTTETGPEV